MHKNFKDRTGEINYNTFGDKIEIVKYNGALETTVRFDNGYLLETDYNNFKKGTIRSPYSKTIYKTGYLGEGEYKPSINNISTIQYIYWKSILSRCYNEKSLKKNPTYLDCEVCEEWHNFQNFAKWFDNNYYTVDDDVMCLDKDILHKGNKIYSPEDCIFVPNNINIIFTKRQNYRGKYPIGVINRNDKYKSRCCFYDNINKIAKRKDLGSFDTPQEAFYKYKEFKENYIKQVADIHRDKIPKQLYDALYRYEVDIND